MRRLLLTVAAALLTTGAAAGPTASADGARGAAECNVATAVRLVDEHAMNNFRLPNPVGQVLCGPFAGPDSEAMAFTLNAPTCWSPQGWAVFRFADGEWRLLLEQRLVFVVAPLVASGGGLREERPVFRPGDPRCIPSGGTQARVWRWDGTALVAGPWAQAKPGTAEPRKPAVFRSPSGNIRCAMREDLVSCWTVDAPQRVHLRAGGRLETCRGRRCIDFGCGCVEGFDYPRLAYGRTIAFGRFRCASLQAGVRCTVSRTGKGFLISRDRISRV